MFRCLEERGISSRILKPLRGVYAQIGVLKRLRGAYGELRTCANGIPQGCLLSMVGHNTMHTCTLTLEAASRYAPKAQDKAYADDINSTITPRGYGEHRTQVSCHRQSL